MRYRLLRFLRCPTCPGARLTVRNVHEREDADVVPGAFPPPPADCACRSSTRYSDARAVNGCICWTVAISDADLVCSSCGVGYTIRGGVPRLTRPDAETDAGLLEIKQRTRDRFAFEWQHYHDLGWLDAPQRPGPASRPTKEIERQSFLTKGLAAPQEFAGKLILDAGCGNGRYSYQARELGGEVIAVDLSEAVDAAARNLRRYPDVHVVQGDIFRLPLAPEIFDRVFSIGVLMHTGDARRAFASVVRHLRPDGVIAITVYRRGNAIYEYVDRALRKRTVELDQDRLLRLSQRLASIARVAWNTRTLTLGRPAVYALLNCFVRLEAKTHNVFDWYAAPYASHHTYDEVYRWFVENDCDVVADRNRRKNALVRVLSSPAGGVTVKGRKRPSPGREPGPRRQFA